MRVYFLSSRAAALKLNGAYLGLIDCFERFVDLNVNDGVLAEVIPDGALPVNFFINQAFFENPPDFADVFVSPFGAVISLARYKSADGGVKILHRVPFCGGFATLYLNGGTPNVCFEGERAVNCELPLCFTRGKLTAAQACGFPLLVAEGDGCITAFNGDGERVFFNPASEWCAEQDRFKITAPTETCAGFYAECEFAFDGRQMTLTASKISKTAAPADEIKHFAFFESVLVKADCTEYLCDSLKPRAGELREFLGEFTGVTVPPQGFYAEHGQMRAAGLTYPVKSNLFNIRYFATEYEGEKICNIYEVEN